MRNYLSLLIVAAVLYVAFDRFVPTHAFSPSQSSQIESISNAYRDHASGLQVAGEGQVIKILPDDMDDSRHQRFILRLPSGQTLLVAHNIDLAPRVSPLNEGDTIAFNGVYEWNAKGGVIHWTHHDPQGHHGSGWLKHNGNIYQ